MTIYAECTPPNRVDVRVDGLMPRADVDAAKHQIHDLMVEHGKCLIVIRLETGMLGMQALSVGTTLMWTTPPSNTSTAFRVDVSARINALYLVRNPEKLNYIGRLQ